MLYVTDLWNTEELALHVAIAPRTLVDGYPQEQQIGLVKYLLTIMPDSIEVKSVDGLTPLLIAMTVRRPDIVSPQMFAA
jgi:hypothetical protein